MSKDADGSLFYAWSENLDKCSLCDKPVGEERVIEERPTGVGFKLQRWAYCPKCWQWTLDHSAISWDRMKTVIFGQQHVPQARPWEWWREDEEEQCEESNTLHEGKDPV